MTPSKKVQALVDDLLTKATPRNTDEAANMLIKLLKERNTAYKEGQNTMRDKVLTLTSKPPVRVRKFEHWRKDMSPTNTFDMGAVSTAAWIHHEVKGLAVINGDRND